MDEKVIASTLKKIQEENTATLAKILEQNAQTLQRALTARPNPGSQGGGTATFKKFHRSTDKWYVYVQQLQQCFLANAIEEDNMKRAYFLAWVGTETFELVQQLCNDNLEAQSFKDLIQKLTDHFVEKQHVLSARFDFFSIKMKAGQTYLDWVADLRGASKDCMFQCVKENCKESYIDQSIRDMIIMHTPHDKVRSAALQKTNPSLEEVLQIATVYESTVKVCSEMKDSRVSDGGQAVNAIYNGKSKNYKNDRARNKTRNYSSGYSKSCPGCGSAHQRSECIHYKNKTKCNECSKLGHIAAVCNSARKNKFGKYSNNNSNHNNNRGKEHIYI